MIGVRGILLKGVRSKADRIDGYIADVTEAYVADRSEKYIATGSERSIADRSGVGGMGLYC